MAKWEPTETRKMTVGTTDTVEDFVSLVKGCYLIASADCYVDFDRVSTTSSFYVKANLVYDLSKVKFTDLHAIRSGGATTLYILAIR